MRSKNYNKKFNNKFIFIIALALLFVFQTGESLHAQSIEELQYQINDKQASIQKLNAEIKSYQSQLNEVGKQADTLQNAIKVLDLNQKKINAEIQKTQTSISSTDLSLRQLARDIGTAEDKIDLSKEATADSLKSIEQTDNLSLPEIVLNGGSLSRALDEYQKSSTLNENLRQHVNELTTYKTSKETTQAEVQKKKAQLVQLKAELGDQNKILSLNKQEKSTLLSQTKSKESEYKKVLAQKQAEEALFEKALFDLESQLKIKVDPGSFPKGKGGIIAWPLDNIVITQKFGKTADSGRLYTSGTHNGVDFRATQGTPVKSVLSGTVKATGNTDDQPGCYSYGKWVLIEHANGLTSLYGHLSLIKVNPGQSVSTGELIGYSGATGYATGPHLHLTIYASQGVRVERYTNSINCKNVSIPVANPTSYLDPMSYLPTS